MIGVALAGALAASCGSSGDGKTKYRDTYFDALIVADGTCTLAPVCVSALETHLAHEGVEIVVACTDVVPVLGSPAQSIQALNSLTGVALAENFPTSGLVGVEFRAYGADCAALGTSRGVPAIFAGSAEAEISNADQQLFVPVSCAQPQVGCEGATPTPTPPACFGCGAP